MHRIEIEVSAPSRTFDTVELLRWLSVMLTASDSDGVVVHRITVEENDA